MASTPDEEIFGVDPLEYRAMFRELQRLRSDVDAIGDILDPQRTYAVDFPFPAVTTEAIGSLAVGGIQRRVNQQTIGSPVWADSVITGERAFNPGDALASGASVHVYREPSKGGLVILPTGGAAGSTTTNQCLCDILTLIEELPTLTAQEREDQILAIRGRCNCQTTCPPCKVDVPNTLTLTFQGFTNQTLAGDTAFYSQLNGQTATVEFDDELGCLWIVSGGLPSFVVESVFGDTTETLNEDFRLALLLDESWTVPLVGATTPQMFNFAFLNAITCDGILGTHAIQLQGNAVAGVGGGSGQVVIS